MKFLLSYSLVLLLSIGSIFCPTVSSFVVSSPNRHGISRGTATTATTTATTTRLYESIPSPEGGGGGGGSLRRPTTTEEETLLRIHCTSKYSDPALLDQVLMRVEDYIVQFPFQKALPIQQMECHPLSTTTTSTAAAAISSSSSLFGAQLIFKRDHDNSQDGGLQFYLIPDDSSSASNNNDENSGGFEIIVKRISQGQTCLKTTTEKLLVRAFVQGFSGQEEYRTKWSSYYSYDPPTDSLVAMESLFHKWMFAP